MSKGIESGRNENGFFHNGYKNLIRNVLRQPVGIYSDDPETNFEVPTMQSLIDLTRMNSVESDNLRYRFTDPRTSRVFTSELVDINPYDPNKPTIITMKGYSIIKDKADSYFADYLNKPEFDGLNVVGTSLFEHVSLAERAERTLADQMLTIARGVHLIDMAVARARETGQKVYILAGSQGGTVAIYHALTSKGKLQADMYFPTTATGDFAQGLMNSRIGKATVDSRRIRKKMSVYKNAYISEMPDDDNLKKIIFPIISKYDHSTPRQVEFWKGFEGIQVDWGHTTEIVRFGPDIISTWIKQHIENPNYQQNWNQFISLLKQLKNSTAMGIRTPDSRAENPMS